MGMNETTGLKLFLMGVGLIVFFAMVNPQSIIVASGPVAFLFAFGGMLASGKWPYSQQRPRPRRPIIWRMKRWYYRVKQNIF